MKTKQTAPTKPPRPGYEVVDKKVQEANKFLKNTDLTVVFEALEKNKIKSQK